MHNQPKTLDASSLPLLAALAQRPTSEFINTTEVSRKHHDVFIDSEIGPPSGYRDLVALLFNASEDDTFCFYINSEGGYLDTALAVIEGLKNTRGRVTACIVGACHSAASMIMLWCHEVAVLDNAHSMVHTATFGTAGFTGNVKAHTDFAVRQVEKLINDTYDGFLTKEELVKIKSGVEMWFDAEEIRARMERRVKLLQARQKKEQKQAAAE